MHPQLQDCLVMTASMNAEIGCETCPLPGEILTRKVSYLGQPMAFKSVLRVKKVPWFAEKFSG